MQYYRSVAAEAGDAALARLAGEFADEETEHVAALDKWIAQTPRPSATWEEDPDPLQPSG
jgi:rubrerythrin